MTTEMDGDGIISAFGQMNFGEKLSARVEVRASDPDGDGPLVHYESIMTESAAYGRDLGKKGPWFEQPREADATVSDFRVYARALAGRGAAALRGAETREGVATVHLTGRFDPEELAVIDSRVARSMAQKGVNGFDCDLWIDQDGRLTRYEQRFATKTYKALNTVIFKDFGPPQAFTAPTVG
ncbi:hypothetical protein [Kitasatospora sp. CMC57]|uniref:Uncharacterized protein n=1 Tax=Kitasatospora sp. CMC57 TaxID=3231513 RepID=A0AB33JNP2_9ACTN